MMAQLMTSLDIENDTQKKHIQELEQFVMLLSQALTQDSGAKSTDAQMIKQFASQFNFSLSTDSNEKLSAQKN